MQIERDERFSRSKPPEPWHQRSPKARRRRAGTKECRGPESNLMIWKKQTKELLVEMFGDLGKFVDSHEHFVPDEVEFDPEDLTLENDPFGFKKGEIKDLKSNRIKEMKELQKNWAPCFTIIKSLLSPEIEARIKELDGYANAAEHYDPLLIYLLSKLLLALDRRSPKLYRLPHQEIGTRRSSSTIMRACLSF